MKRILATGSWLLATSSYSVRTLFRSPGFTLAAVLTLALGIGANTAIFSVVDAVLLRPLPYPDSDRLVMVWDKLVKFNLPRRSPEYHTADAYRRLDNIFELTGGIFWYDTTLSGNTGTDRVSVMTVSPQIFEMLAPRTAFGRIFASEEYRTGADPTVILGHSLFLRRFGGDPSILGKSIQEGTHSRRVVGVMSPDFDFNMRAGDVDLWIPVPLDTRRSWGNATRMLARLRPGVSLATAQAALSAAAKHVDETEHPYAGPHGEDAGYGVTVVTLHDQFLGEYRTVALLLLAAVAVVLLIACVNVANLMLVRAVAREKETAVRRALGATNGRLIAQWLTESSMLALLGGALGTLAAVWGVKLLATLSPAASSALNQSAHRIGSGVARIGIDGRALLFTLAISIAACLLFGLAPGAWRVAPLGTRGATRHSRRAASTLVTAEVALAFMLMIGAGLLLKSFSRLTHVNPGFNASHLLIMRTEFNRNTSRAERVTFYQDLREKMAAMPGVVSATMGDPPVGGGGINAGAGDPFGIKGKSYDAANQFASFSAAGVDYFRTFEIPMRAGRAFTAADSAAAGVGVAAAKEYPSVVIVNETLARTFYPDGAVGQQIGLPPPCRDTKCDFVWMTIVGVAGDVKTRGLDMPARPVIYIPQPQTGGVILRTVGDPLQLARAASLVIRSADPDVAVYDVRTMEDRISQTVTQPKFQTMIVSFFAASALFLAAIGIFAVVAHSTAQRTQEIGIRMALGADRGRVVQSVISDGLRPVLFGVVLGLAGALAFGHILASVLFNVAAADPFTFVVAAAVLTLVAILACLGPANRATKVDPMIALRSE